jgi:hypothetical protein
MSAFFQSIGAIIATTISGVITFFGGTPFPPPQATHPIPSPLATITPAAPLNGAHQDRPPVNHSLSHIQECANWTKKTEGDRFVIRGAAVFVDGHLIKEADAETFEMWSNPGRPTSLVWYGRDSRHVFRGIQLYAVQDSYYAIVPDADPMTFCPLIAGDGFSGFSRDHSHVYHSHDKGWEIDDHPNQIEFVSEADPKSFNLRARPEKC